MKRYVLFLLGWKGNWTGCDIRLHWHRCYTGWRRELTKTTRRRRRKRWRGEVLVFFGSQDPSLSLAWTKSDRISSRIYCLVNHLVAARPWTLFAGGAETDFPSLSFALLFCCCLFFFFLSYVLKSSLSLTKPENTSFVFHYQIINQIDCIYWSEDIVLYIIISGRWLHEKNLHSSGLRQSNGRVIRISFYVFVYVRGYIMFLLSYLGPSHSSLLPEAVVETATTTQQRRLLLPMLLLLLLLLTQERQREQELDGGKKVIWGLLASRFRTCATPFLPRVVHSGSWRCSTSSSTLSLLKHHMHASWHACASGSV